MRIARRWTLPAAAILVVVAAAILAPAAGAAEMPSQTSVGPTAQVAKANVAAERQVVQKALVDLGLSKEQAAQRLQLLTDDEVHALAAQVQSIRAGGAGQQTFSLEQVLLIAILIVLIAR